VKDFFRGADVPVEKVMNSMRMLRDQVANCPAIPPAQREQLLDVIDALNNQHYLHDLQDDLQ